MTVSSETAKVTYNGDGSTSSFSVTFYFLDTSDVKVIHRDAGGNETTWTEGSQYALTGAGAQSGGTVTVSTSPADYTPAAGETLTIKRNLDLTQETDYPEGGQFPASAHEDALDRSAMRDQQLKEEVDRKIGFSETSTASATLPDPEANKILTWNAAGTDLQNAVPADLSLVTVVSSFAETLLDDADAAAARSTLGVAIGSDVQAYDADTLKSDTSDTLTKGMLANSHNLGNLNTNTTLSIANGNLQHGTLGGSITLTAPNDSDEGWMELELTVDGTGGYTLTLSGFNTVSGEFDNTAGKVNVLRMVKHNTNTYIDIVQAA